MKKIVIILCSLFFSTANAQSWRDCVPNSIGPGGCDSIAPGGGMSMHLVAGNPSGLAAAYQSAQVVANQ